jgi:hypothetical protein
MNEFRDPEAWRTRSRIPRASGAWVGVARVQTASRTDDSWMDDDWVEEACLEDGPVPDHLDARSWAASMLATESRRAEAYAPAPRGTDVPPPSARLERGAVIPAPRSAAESDAAWSVNADFPEEDYEYLESPAVAGREYSARRTPLSSGDSGRHRAPRALRLVYSANRVEPDSPAQRSEGETYEGPVNRPGGQSGAILPTPTEETTPA